MPRNVSGVMQLPASSVNPPVPTQTIVSADYQAEQVDIAAEITNSLDRLGRAPMLANLPMGSFKITGLSTVAPTSGTEAAPVSYVQSWVPSGVIAFMASNVAPAGWLECDGSAISRTSFSSLFTAIATIWGVGDGSTTFNIPDFRGYFLRAWDHGSGVDPGRAYGSLGQGPGISGANRNWAVMAIIRT